MLNVVPLVAALRRELRNELDALRGNWFWFAILGIAPVVLSTVALGSAVIASLAAAAAISVLLLLGGEVEAVGAFWCESRWISSSLCPDRAMIADERMYCRT